MLLIVPNYIADEINAAIDKALDGRPCPPEARENIYNTVLLHFHEHGAIPDFSLNQCPSTDPYPSPAVKSIGPVEIGPATIAAGITGTTPSTSGS